MSEDNQKVSMWRKMRGFFRKPAATVSTTLPPAAVTPVADNAAEKMLRDIGELLGSLAGTPGYILDVVNSRRTQIESLIRLMQQDPKQAIAGLKRIHTHLKRDYDTLKKPVEVTVADVSEHASSAPVPELPKEEHKEENEPDPLVSKIVESADDMNDLHRSAEDIHDEVVMLLASLKKRNVISHEHHEEERKKLNALMVGTEKVHDKDRFAHLRGTLIEKRNRLRTMLPHAKFDHEKLVDVLHHLERTEIAHDAAARAAAETETYVATTHWPEKVTNVRELPTKGGHKVTCGRNGELCVFRMPKAIVQPHALVPYEKHHEHIFSMQTPDLSHALAYVNEHVLDEDNKIDSSSLKRGWSLGKKRAPRAKEEPQKEVRETNNEPAVAPQKTDFFAPIEEKTPVVEPVKAELPVVPAPVETVKLPPVEKSEEPVLPIETHEPPLEEKPEVLTLHPLAPEPVPEPTRDPVAEAIQNGAMERETRHLFVDDAGLFNNAEQALQAVGVEGREQKVLAEVIGRHSPDGPETRLYRLFGDSHFYESIQTFIQGATPTEIGMGAKNRLQHSMRRLHEAAVKLELLEKSPAA